MRESGVGDASWVSGLYSCEDSTDTTSCIQEEKQTEWTVKGLGGGSLRCPWCVEIQVFCQEA